MTIEELAWMPIETMPEGEVGLCTAEHRADAEMCINKDNYPALQGYRFWMRIPHVESAKALLMKEQ